MLPYWLMFLLPALLAVNSSPLQGFNNDGTRRVRVPFSWICVFLVLVAVVGFRFQVGGDWNNYFRYLWRAENLQFIDLLGEEDPGYMAINIYSSSYGWGITGVNIFCAAIFGAGVVVFSRSLPRPWLALACAVPYLIIVVGMGYTRQAAALGLVMVGLVALRRDRFLQFAIWVALGALFHKTAVLIIPIALLTAQRRRFQAFGLVAAIAYSAYDALLASHADRLVNVYIENEYTESEGALIRLLMNAVPASLFLYFSRRFVLSPTEQRLWSVMSWISIMMLLALFSTGFTTALDRMALYFIPLQLAVFSNLPDALGRPGARNSDIISSIVLYYAAVLFVWLNFAGHSFRWVPYKMGLSLN